MIPPVNVFQSGHFAALVGKDQNGDNDTAPVEHIEAAEGPGSGRHQQPAEQEQLGEPAAVVFLHFHQYLR
ncbi:hypothetical protein [Anoxynatronum sibiricum]|uniref:hypothetical protein n=1 Tax=Anoxynatronum sibiricum TaxID=210623 RepID=UPI0031B832C9